MIKEASQSESRDTVLGTVERVVFQNPDNGWCVLKVKVKGRRRLVSVVGHSVLVVPGETIEASGEWTEHADYGERFEADRMKTTLPRVASAAQKFLSSGFVRGIGEEIAHRMVARFGAAIFDIIANSPDLLREVEGIGPARARSIQQAWHEQRALREIMEFLGSNGLSASFAPRIHRVFGPDAIEIVRQHPYRLALEVPGVGFKSADLLAKHEGLAPDSEERIAAALHDRLQAALSRGHCAYPSDSLVSEASREIDVPADKIIGVLESEVDSGRFTEEDLGAPPRECVFPSSIAKAERRLAENLIYLNRARPLWQRGRGTRKATRGATVVVPRRSALALSRKQEEALRQLLGAKVGVLTGGPGTGKTTLIREFHHAVAGLGFKVVCCAPTGRAAQRLTEASGVEALTVHRLLGFDPVGGGFLHGAHRTLELDLLILDEASMVGLEVMDALVQALPDDAALLLVGDVDQLPSIQAGRVLDSIIESRAFSHIHLEEIFRQTGGEASRIIRAAHDVIHGQVPDLRLESPSQEFHFIEARDPLACSERIVRLVRDRIPAAFGLDPFSQVQVLCPMNRGEAGARVLNKKLQEALNPNPSESVERFGNKLSVGDKVIVTMNDYDKEIFNGDIGRIVQIEKDRSSLRVDFGGNRRIEFNFTEADLLSLAFAISIHKAQGSEYEAVVIPLLEESTAMLSRNLLYTGMTRGRRLVVIVGSRAALERAVHSHRRSEQRWSGLSKRLVESQASVSQGLSSHVSSGSIG